MKMEIQHRDSWSERRMLNVRSGAVCREKDIVMTEGEIELAMQEYRGNGRAKLESKSENAADTVVEFLRQRAWWHKWYFQYIASSNLIKQFETGTIWFTTASAMNDGDEVERVNLRKRKFFFCMTYGIAENVAMWANYGIPRQQALRVRYDGKAFRRFICAFQTLKVVRKDGKPLGVVLRRGVDYDVAFHDMMYKRKGKSTFRYRDGVYRMSTIDIEGFDDGHADIWKKWGWSYEYETRVVVTVKHNCCLPLDTYALVAGFSDVQKMSARVRFVEKNEKVVQPAFITLGPWSGKAERCDVMRGLKNIKGIDAIPDVMDSEFSGEIKFKSWQGDGEMFRGFWEN